MVFSCIFMYFHVFSFKNRCETGSRVSSRSHKPAARHVPGLPREKMGHHDGFFNAPKPSTAAFSKGSKRFDVRTMRDSRRLERSHTWTRSLS